MPPLGPHIAWVAFVAGCTLLQAVEARPFLYDHDPTVARRKRVGGTIHDARRKRSTTHADASKSCPPRPSIPTTIPGLPASALNAVWAMANQTLAPCVPFASSPSTATSISASVILGPHTYYFNNGCLSSWTKEKVAPTEDTIYRLASVSKTYVVDGVIQALEQQKVRSLDDPLSAYLPGFSIINTYTSDQPTLRQLGSQQAGLPRDTPCNFLDCNRTTPEMLDRVAQLRLITAPYERPSYSNLAYSLLGHTLAEYVYSYGDYNDYLEAMIAAPLNMTSTGLRFTPDIIQRMAQEYTKGGVPVPLSELYWDNPAGGMYTSTRDMAVWLRHFNDGWQRSAVYKELFQPIFVDGTEKMGWGMPWEIIDSTEATGYLIRTKGGYIPGVSSIIALVPELALGVSVLWNGEGMDDTYLVVSMVNALLPHIIASYERQAQLEWPPVSNNFINSGYLGVYALDDAVRANITLVGALVVATIPGFGQFSLRPSTLPGDGGLIFQLYQPTSSYPICMNEAFAAYVGEWVYFSTSSSGTQQFSVPGYVWGNFTKIA